MASAEMDRVAMETMVVEALHPIERRSYKERSWRRGKTQEFTDKAQEFLEKYPGENPDIQGVRSTRPVRMVIGDQSFDVQIWETTSGDSYYQEQWLGIRIEPPGTVGKWQFLFGVEKITNTYSLAQKPAIKTVAKNSSRGAQATNGQIERALEAIGFIEEELAKQQS